MLDKITLVNSFGVRNRCLTVPRVGNPGLALGNTFGVRRDEIIEQSLPIREICLSKWRW